MLGRVKRRLIVAAAAVALVLVGRAVAGTMGAVLAFLVLGMGGFISFRMHPRHACPQCGGTSRFYSKVFPHRFRMCSYCGGNGRVLSRSATLWGSTAHRNELRDAAQARKGARPWSER